MSPTKSAATETKKRKRGLDLDELEKLVNTTPEDYKTAWDELKHRIIELNEHAGQNVSSVSSLTIVVLLEW